MNKVSDEVVTGNSTCQDGLTDLVSSIINDWKDFHKGTAQFDMGWVAMHAMGYYTKIVSLIASCL